MAKVVDKKVKSKSDIVDKVAQKNDATKVLTKAIVDAFLGEIEGTLKAGGKVQIAGFGTFEVRQRKARTGVKPGTDIKIKIPASKAPAFKAGKALKDSVNKKK